MSEEQLTTAKPPNRSPAEAAAARELLGSLMVDWLTDRHKIYCYFAERGDLMAGVGPGFFLYMFGPGGGHVHIPISDDDDDAHRLARVLWVLDAYGIRLPGSRIPAFR